MDQPKCDRVYDLAVCDSRRWNDFRPRAGDIIVCTPPKSGTTWTQMICALLRNGSPHLPKPLTAMSRWLDRHTIPIDDLLRELEAEPGPRIIKTHTPLDGLPYFPEAHYVFCCRDPRDAFLSFLDHVANLSDESMADLNRRRGLPEDERPDIDPDTLFCLWTTTGVQPWAYDGAPFGLPHVYTAETFWRYRHLPNIHLLHFADLKADLEGEMRRLADRLGYRIDEDEWPGIVAAAGFAAMKGQAASTAPNADLGEWKSPDAFFASGRLGAWHDALSAESLATYEAVNAARLDPALKHWVECGGPA